MMYYLFGWLEGQAKGGMGDYLSHHVDRDRAMDAFDYATGSLDRVHLIEFVGSSWKRIAGFDRGMNPEGRVSHG